MRKAKKDIIIILISFIPVLTLLLLAYIWSLLGNKTAFIMHLVVGGILAMGFPALLICQKLDERFDRLEVLLKEKLKGEKEEKESKSDNYNV